ncbi:MAG TPA: hypothetical protein VGS62_07070 [Streptosporangiaceae bacterium]|nr:hypothetical protein [Streptosporangiaceae bacterium]
MTGAGLATVVPVIFSAVGEFDRAVGHAMSLVATFGYAGELGGPAFIGPLAGATSLRIALLVPTGLTVVIAILGPVAVRRAARPVASRVVPPGGVVAPEGRVVPSGGGVAPEGRVVPSGGVVAAGGRVVPPEDRAIRPGGGAA